LPNQRSAGSFAREFSRISLPPCHLRAGRLPALLLESAVTSSCQQLRVRGGFELKGFARDTSLPFMRIPSHYIGRHTLNPFWTDEYFFQRDLNNVAPSERILAESGFRGRNRIIEYGCGIGGWTWPLSKLCREVIGYDTDEKPVRLGQEFLAFNGCSSIQLTTELATGTFDEMTCMLVLEILTHRQIHSVFEFAFSRLDPGGIFLVNSVSLGLLVEWAMTCARVKVNGWQEYFVYLEKLKVALSLMSVDRIDLHTYCLPPNLLVSLATSKGLRLKYGPSAYDRLPETHAFDYVSPSEKAIMKHLDWFLFEKPQ
jgi:precorrin-6B methylase 2